MRNNSKTVKFTPTGRNLGGRTQIESMQRNHILALINTQASLNTMKPPHKHVDHGRQGKSLGPKNFKIDEVKETYRRVLQVKHGYTDSNEPKTFQFKEQLKHKNSIKKSVESSSHENNINSMMRNILRINQKSQKRIGNLNNLSRNSIDVSVMSQLNRVKRHQWDDRTSHPFQSQWQTMKQQKKNSSQVFEFNRPQSYSKNSIGNLLSLDGNINQPNQKISKKFLSLRDEYHSSNALDYTEGLRQQKQNSQNEYDNNKNQENEIEMDQFMLIDQFEGEEINKDLKSEKQQFRFQNMEENYQKLRLAETMKLDDELGKGARIYDKNTKAYRNINVPFVQQMHHESKQYRQVKRIIMQIIMDYKRDQIIQVGECLVKKNNWLSNERVLEVCQEISKNFYGLDAEDNL